MVMSFSTIFCSTSAIIKRLYHDSVGKSKVRIVICPYPVNNKRNRSICTFPVPALLIPENKQSLSFHMFPQVFSSFSSLNFPRCISDIYLQTYRASEYLLHCYCSSLSQGHCNLHSSTHIHILQLIPGIYQKAVLFSNTGASWNRLSHLHMHK